MIGFARCNRQPLCDCQSEVGKTSMQISTRSSEKIKCRCATSERTRKSVPKQQNQLRKECIDKSISLIAILLGSYRVMAWIAGAQQAAMSTRILSLVWRRWAVEVGIGSDEAPNRLDFVGRSTRGISGRETRSCGHVPYPLPPLFKTCFAFCGTFAVPTNKILSVRSVSVTLFYVF